jgi:hypothetical protein
MPVDKPGRAGIDTPRTAVPTEVLLPSGLVTQHGTDSFRGARPDVAAPGDTGAHSSPPPVVRVSRSARSEDTAALTLARKTEVTGHAAAAQAAPLVSADGVPSSPLAVASARSAGSVPTTWEAADSAVTGVYPSGSSGLPLAAPTARSPSTVVSEAPSVIARTAEIAAGSAPAPTLVWRRAAPAVTPAVDQRGETWVARSGADGARVGATPIAMPPAGPASPVSPAAASPPAAAPMPDLNRLAEQVTRIIVRRLEVEHERRGGKRWN